MVNNVNNRGALILSAHADDAALSIGCVLTIEPLFYPATIVTVFSRTDFAPLLVDQGEERVSRVRSEEDRRFSSILGCDLIELGYRDAKLRLNKSRISALFDSSRLVPEDLVQNVVADLYAVASSCRPALIVSPLGVGNHIDHRVVRICSDVFASSTGTLLLLYEDQPYASLGNAIPNDVPHNTSRGTFLEVAVSESVVLREAKRYHAALYASQPAALRTRDLVSGAAGTFYERLWICDSE